MFMFKTGPSTPFRFCHITHFGQSLDFLTERPVFCGFNCYSRVCVASRWAPRARIPRKYVSHLNSFCCVYLESVFKSRRNFNHIAKLTYEVDGGCDLGDEEKMWVPQICSNTFLMFLTVAELVLSLPVHGSDDDERTRKGLLTHCYFCLRNRLH